MTPSDTPFSEEALLSLLDSYTVAERDIEQRVLTAWDQEAAQKGLRAEVSALRQEVSALREDIAELKRLLLARREPLPVVTATITTDTTRGMPLLPYARQEETTLFIG